MWTSLLKELTADCIPWDGLSERRFLSVSSSEESDYLNVCKMLLLRLDKACPLSDENEAIIDSIILKKNLLVLNVLVNQLKICHEQCFRRDKILDLLKKFFTKKNHLEGCFKIFLGLEDPTKREGKSDLISLLINIPSIVANQLELKTPQIFSPHTYFARVLNATFLSFEKATKRLKSGKDTSIEFFCYLIGKTAFSGYSEIVYRLITSEIIKKAETDYVWRRIGQKLMEAQTDLHIEYIVRPLFQSCKGFKKISWVLADLPQRKAKLQYLLTEKFISVYYYEESDFIRNLIGYLAFDVEKLLPDCFRTLIEAWTNGRALRTRSFEQQMHLCSGLVLFASYVKIDFFHKDREQITRKLVEGVEVYLKCADEKTRLTGLYTGQLLLKLIQKEGPQLNLQIEQIPEVQKLVQLYQEGMPDIENISLEHQEEEKFSGELSDHLKALNISGKIKEEGSEEEGSEEEDDLEPFDMSNDVKIEKTKKPVYLSDCIAGLLESDKPEWTIVCLENVSSLIEKNGSMTDDYAQDLCKALLHLNDPLDTADFETTRLNALIKLTVTCPLIVSTLLAKEFYDRNLVLQKRVDVLEVLATASVELSKEKSKSQLEPTEDIFPKDVVIVESKWKSIVEERIKSKTKVISTPRESKTRTNPFAKYAGNFFFPLMKNYDNPSLAFNLMGEDYFLLGKLLYTLAIILDSASETYVARKMGEVLLEFLWAVRCHVESFVRKAVIFCFCIILTAVPSVHLTENLYQELFEFQKWLIDVTKMDSDRECIQRALTALFLLNNLNGDRNLILK